MSNDRQLEMLVELWEESYESGTPLDPNELCKESQHLLAQLLAHIEGFKAMERIRLRVRLPPLTNSTCSDVSSRSVDDSSTADYHRASKDNSSVDLNFLNLPRGSGELGWIGEDYCVWKVLGQGGMGLVLEVENVRLSRREALKLIRPDRDNIQARERFEREAKTLASVNHMNVVPIYHVGEFEGLPFLTMPLLRGESLFHRVNRETMLSIDQVIHIGKQIAQGMAAAHKKGLVHRDLKPGNVWLGTLATESSSEPERAILLDFGLARPVDLTDPVTSEGQIPGTISYMSPEQFSGQPLDERTDLFSLGVLLYKITTGRVPFRGASPLAYAYQLANHRPPSPDQLRKNVPAELSSLIETLLCKDREQRTITAQQLANRLDHFQQFAPIEEPLSGPHNNTELEYQTTLEQANTHQPVHMFKKWSWSTVAVLGLIGCILFFLFWRPWVPQHIPIKLMPEQPLPISELPFSGFIDVRVTKLNDGNPKAYWLYDFEALPVKAGDECVIQVTLDRPGYVYVLWFTNEGKFDPVYPWKEGSWNKRPQTESPVKSVRVPETNGHIIEILPGKKAMEMLILLVRETPLPVDVDLNETLGQMKPIPIRDPKEYAWFVNGKWNKDKARSGNLKEPRMGSLTIDTVQGNIYERLKDHFPYVQVVGFPNEGGPGR